MSAIRHSFRFCVDQMYEFRWLYIGSTMVMTAVWAVDYLFLAKGHPESVLIWPVCFGGGLFIIWILALIFALRRNGLSIRQYGELNKDEAAEFHNRIANTWLGPKKT